MITLRPITLVEANRMIVAWHSHHEPVLQAIAKIGAEVDGALVGCVLVEPPRANELRKVGAYELTRMACDGSHAHVASKLARAAWKCVEAQGVRRLVSYTRVDEEGTSYRAAGWCAVALVKGRGWDTGNKADRWLPGLYEPTTEVVDRVRWEIGPDSAATRVHRLASGKWTTTPPKEPHAHR